MNARIPTPMLTNPEEREMAVPGLLPLNEDTIIILGRADFACARTAQRLRELGHKIGRNPQEEQAAVIHLNLTMYQKHGAAWFAHANAYLEGEEQAADRASQVHPSSALPSRTGDPVADTMDRAQLQALGEQQKGGA